MTLDFNLPGIHREYIRDRIEECPGVFYLSVCRPDSIVRRELYAVLPSAVPEIISEETITYGNQIGDICFFEYDVEHNGWHLVQFEILRYKTKHGFLQDKTESLYSVAMFAAELYPEYFGETIPPRCTPWGLVIRHRKVADGIYFLETDRCQWVLALSFPVWSIDLSDSTQKHGSFCAEDKRLGQKEAEYLYFRRDDCEPVIFELLQNEAYKKVKDFWKLPI